MDRNDNAELDRPIRSFAADELPEFSGQFRAIREGVPYHSGTTVRMPGIPLTARPSGLLTPAAGRGSGPSDFVKLFMVIEDYIDTAGLDLSSEVFVRWALALAEKPAIVRSLAGLALVQGDEGHEAKLADFFRRTLPDRAGERFGRILPQRALVAPQPLLMAFREVLGADDWKPRLPGQTPSDAAALMLTHAYASGLTHDIKDAPTDVVELELVRNLMFNGSDDEYALMDRYTRLWEEYGPRVADHLGGRTPSEIFFRAAGLEIRDALALGFALYSHVGAWKPGKPLAVNADLNSGMESNRKEAFIRLVSSTEAEFAERFSPGLGEWDFLAFQEHPVLRVEEGLLIIDDGFLVDRFTSGLYWVVHDHLKATEGELARQRWTQAWADMVETMVEDDLGFLAPKLLRGGKAIYFEEDLAKAYPEHKTADTVIDFGERFVAFEIVSGQISVNTRVHGSLMSYEADLERLVFKKLRQLDDTASCLIRDAGALTGANEVAARPVLPVVVVGGGFALSPPIARRITEHIARERLFKGQLVGAPAVIDLAELEMLEGLAESGEFIVDVIGDWKASDLAEMPLRNYLLRRYPAGGQRFRAARVRPRMKHVFEDILNRAQIRG